MAVEQCINICLYMESLQGHEEEVPTALLMICLSYITTSAFCTKQAGRSSLDVLETLSRAQLYSLPRLDGCLI